MQGMILDPGLQPGDERHQLVSSPKSFHFPNRSNSLQGGQQPSGPYNCLGLAKSFFFFWPRHEHPQLPLSDNQTPSPWSESTGLNHWTTRAVPLLSLLVAGERRNSCLLKEGGSGPPTLGQPQALLARQEQNWEPTVHFRNLNSQSHFLL